MRRIVKDSWKLVQKLFVPEQFHCLKIVYQGGRISLSTLVEGNAALSHVRIFLSLLGLASNFTHNMILSRGKYHNCLKIHVSKCQSIVQWARINFSSAIQLVPWTSVHRLTSSLERFDIKLSLESNVYNPRNPHKYRGTIQLHGGGLFAMINTEKSRDSGLASVLNLYSLVKGDCDEDWPLFNAKRFPSSYLLTNLSQF